MNKFIFPLVLLCVIILTSCHKEKEEEFIRVTSGLTYTIDAIGEIVDINVETNTNYFVSIPDDAKSWISVVGSRATMQDVFTLSISPNNTAYRTAKISLKNKSGEVLANIQISQDVLNTDWIDSEFAKVLENRGYIKHASTITIKEVEQLTKIDISGTDYSNRGTLKSMKGLEYFVNLEELKCHSNLLTELNVSSLKKLKILECHENYLSSLTLNTNLEYLTCYTNEIIELDLKGLNKLKVMDCSNNRFSTLNLKDQEDLAKLTCAYLGLISLDVSNNKKLEYLGCYTNKLKGINITQNKLLDILDVKGNPGDNGVFTITAWFNAENVPFTIGFDGKYNGIDNMVKLNIVKE
ncbi:MAG: hypothetical protein K2H44_04885 [Muribaculaceae bacterium]|nr:hypothetical protein [Muribaculaceae bacterium]